MFRSISQCEQLGCEYEREQWRFCPTSGIINDAELITREHHSRSGEAENIKDKGCEHSTMAVRDAADATERHTDGFGEMVKIEKDMKLRELTKKIRIDRKMDAPNIKALDLTRSGQTFTVYDYEIRKSEKTGEANWIKMLIGMPEVTDDGELTGKMLAREVHGGMMGIVAWMVAAEHEYGKKNLLPLEDVRIVDECGYIFEGSTNQMEYIEINS